MLRGCLFVGSLVGVHLWDRYSPLRRHVMTPALDRLREGLLGAHQAADLGFAASGGSSGLSNGLPWGRRSYNQVQQALSIVRNVGRAACGRIGDHRRGGNGLRTRVRQCTINWFERQVVPEAVRNRLVDEVAKICTDDRIVESFSSLMINALKSEGVTKAMVEKVDELLEQPPVQESTTKLLVETMQSDDVKKAVLAKCLDEDIRAQAAGMVLGGIREALFNKLRFPGLSAVPSLASKIPAGGSGAGSVRSHLE